MKSWNRGEIGNSRDNNKNQTLQKRTIGKMVWRHHMNQKESTICIHNIVKLWNFYLEKRLPDHHFPELACCREVVADDLFHKHSTPTVKRKGSLTATYYHLSWQAGSRSWHHPCSSGFICMWNAKVVGSRRLSLRFQRKIWDKRWFFPW